MIPRMYSQSLSVNWQNVVILIIITQLHQVQSNAPQHYRQYCLRTNHKHQHTQVREGTCAISFTLKKGFNFSTGKASKVVVNVQQETLNSVALLASRGQQFTLNPTINGVTVVLVNILDYIVQSILYYLTPPQDRYGANCNNKT